MANEEGLPDPRAVRFYFYVVSRARVRYRDLVPTIRSIMLCVKFITYMGYDPHHLAAARAGTAKAGWQDDPAESMTLCNYEYTL